MCIKTDRPKELQMETLPNFSNGETVTKEKKNKTTNKTVRPIDFAF